MPIRFWNTHQLAIDLSISQLSAAQRFQYLVASNVIWVFAGYAGAYFVTPPSGWLYWYECLLILVVTVFGLIRCRDRYQNNEENRLIEAVVILGVPLGIKLLLFTWAAHMAFSWGLPWALSGVTLSAESPITLIEFLVKATYRSYPFLISVVGVAIYYLRLVGHLQTAAGVSSDT